MKVLSISSGSGGIAGLMECVAAWLSDWPMRGITAHLPICSQPPRVVSALDCSHCGEEEHQMSFACFCLRVSSRFVSNRSCSTGLVFIHHLYSATFLAATGILFAQNCWWLNPKSILTLASCLQRHIWKLWGRLVLHALKARKTQFVLWLLCAEMWDAGTHGLGNSLKEILCLFCFAGRILSQFAALGWPGN